MDPVIKQPLFQWKVSGTRDTKIREMSGGCNTLIHIPDLPVPYIFGTKLPVANI